MSQYLALFDATGRLTALRDLEFIAMLQLMGRTGTVSGEQGSAGVQRVVGRGGSSGGMLRPVGTTGVWLVCCAAAACRSALELTATRCLPACARLPACLPPQVFSPVQKARVVAACYPHFPDVVQLVRILASGHQQQLQAQQQPQGQQQPQPQQQQGVLPG